MRPAEPLTLAIDPDVRASMMAAAQTAAPLEACGLLGGRDGQAALFYELANTDASGEHYSMSPSEQFAAIKDMRAKDAEMLAIWHSHPATPARMSEEDLRLAYTPGVIYLIVSLAVPDQPDIRGFAVNDGSPEETEITMLTPSPRSETT